MKVLFAICPVGYGHTSRELAVMEELDKLNIDYEVMVPESHVDFLIANNIRPDRINTNYHGTEFLYTKTKNGTNLDYVKTIKKIILDTPQRIMDIKKIFERLMMNNEFDLLINDYLPHLIMASMFKSITVSNNTPINNIAEWVNQKKTLPSVLYENVIIPYLRVYNYLTDTFYMDLRPDYINYETVFPPMVRGINKSKNEIRSTICVRNNEILVLDGRNVPPTEQYKKIANEYNDIKFIVRDKGSTHPNIISIPFMERMINYINASDVFITATGFTSVSETAITRTPMIFQPPERHIEQEKSAYIAKNYNIGIERSSNIIDDIDYCLSNGYNGPRLENSIHYMIDKILSL